jgi:hypothetical protein
MNKLPKVLATILPVAAFLILTTPAFAAGFPNFGNLFHRQNDDSKIAQNTPKIGDDNRSGQEVGSEGRKGASSAAGLRLQDAKLKSCQARENAIGQRSTSLTGTVNSMFSKFDAIAQRVEEYYTSKVVPSGKTVSNYDNLVSDIQVKKAAVGTVLLAAQSDSAGFSCTSGDPKGQMTKFRLDMQSVMNALKNYRTSIKNLIVAVRSVVGQTNSDQNQASGSAK